MALPTIYSSEDASAPAMAYTAGGLIPVLDAVLVNGYGAKAAAGWTKIFSDVNKAVYRNTAGVYLRVDDSVSYGADVDMFETMSDVDTGTGSFVQNNISRWYVGNYASTHTWYFIADDQAVYFVYYPTSTSKGLISFAGQYKSHAAAPQYNHILFSSNSTSSSYTSHSYAWRESSSAKYAMRDVAGLYGSVQLVHLRYTHMASAIGFPGACPVAASYPNTPDGQLYVSDLLLVDDAETNILGQLPGMYLPVNLNTAQELPATITGTGDYLGREYLFMPLYYGSALLQTNADWWV